MTRRILVACVCIFLAWGASFSQTHGTTLSNQTHAEMQTMGRPFLFPLYVGKSWTYRSYSSAGGGVRTGIHIWRVLSTDTVGNWTCMETIIDTLGGVVDPKIDSSTFQIHDSADFVQIDMPNNGGQTTIFLRRVPKTIDSSNDTTGLCIRIPGGVDGSASATYVNGIGLIAFTYAANSMFGLRWGMSLSGAIPPCVTYGLPNLVLSPARIQMHTVPVGESRDTTYALINTGPAPLALTDISIYAVPSDFSVRVSWSSVLPLGQRVDTLRFTPVRSGPVNGMVVYTTNSPGSPDTLTISVTDDTVRTDAIPKGIQTPIPLNYVLHQNFPNPFNGLTHIRYDLPFQGGVTLTVFNMVGQQVGGVIQDETAAGSYDFVFDAGGLASGTYFYRLRAGTYLHTMKMVIVR